MPADQIQQLYCTAKTSSSRNGTSTAYELHALTSGGEDRKLLKVDELEQALFIEQEVEKFLGIADVPVRGEIPR